MSDPYLTEARWAGTVLRVRGRLDAGPDGALKLELCERDGPRSCALPVAVEPGDNGSERFSADVDVLTAADGGPLPHGLWDIILRRGSYRASLGRERGPELDGSPQRLFLPDSTMVSAYFTVPGGTLALDVGGDPHPAGSTTADALAWNDEDDELVVCGHVDVRDITTPVSATLTLRERGSDRVYEVIARLDAEPTRLGYTASVPMTRAFIDDPLPRGTWDAFLVLGFSGMHRELRVLAPADPVELHVRRRLRPVKVGTTKAPEPLAIIVGRS
ncbi:hypothetical protein [Actinomadura hibisca]|uniref:hypothetical protein n=1 Tax=Actinomadura hibisca TaxID=68565 RepID=UPI000834E15C|nr:hypothetical protein [Actinomadura hibisca]